MLPGDSATYPLKHRQTECKYRKVLHQTIKIGSDTIRHVAMPANGKNVFLLNYIESFLQGGLCRQKFIDLTPLGEFSEN